MLKSLADNRKDTYQSIDVRKEFIEESVIKELERRKHCIEKEIRPYEENMDSFVPNINEIKGMIACENIRLMDQKELKRCFQKYVKKITINDGDKLQISLIVHTNGTP